MGALRAETSRAQKYEDIAAPESTPPETRHDNPRNVPKPRIYGSALRQFWEVILTVSIERSDNKSETV